MRQPQQPNARRGNERWIALAVAVLGFLAFVGTVRNGFVNWDDDRYVYENAFIQAFDTQFFRRACAELYFANWHPLTWLSHAVDYHLWGLNPAGHHLTSVLLNALVAYLVVLLGTDLHRLAATSAAPPTRPGDQRALAAAGITGALFATHPIHVESVAWVSERKDLLCAVFFVASVLAYLRGLAATGHPLVPTPRHAWRSAPMRWALLLMALALLAKPMAVTLPAVFLVLDWYPGRRLTSWRRFLASVAEKLPFLMLSVASSIVTLAAQEAAAALEEMPDLSLLDRIGNASVAIVTYLGKMAWPGAMPALVPYRTGRAFTSPEVIASVTIVLALTVLSALQARKRPWLLAGWAYFITTLLPVLGLVQVGGHALAYRYTYLPSIGPLLLAGMLVSRLWWARPPCKQAFRVVSGCVLATLVGVTQMHIAVWRDGITLWQHVIAHEPSAVMAYQQLGNILMQHGDVRGAARVYAQGLTLAPGRPGLLNNAAISEFELGRLDRAERYARAALLVEGNQGNALNTLGEIHLKRGDIRAANQSFLRSLDQDPTVPARNFNTALTYEKLGDMANACRYWQRYVALAPYASDAGSVQQHIDDLRCAGSPTVTQ